MDHAILENLVKRIKVGYLSGFLVRREKIRGIKETYSFSCNLNDQRNIWFVWYWKKRM